MKNNATWAELYQLWPKSEDRLARTVKTLLESEDWATGNNRGEMYEFLAKHWAEDGVEGRVHDAMKFWDKARRDALHASLAPYLHSLLGGAELIVDTIDKIQAEEVRYIWEPYILDEHLTLLEGERGIGKSYLSLAIAAAVASGWPLPNQHGEIVSDDLAAQGNVLIVAREDSPGAVIKPRLIALGLSRDAQAAIGVLRGVRQGGTQKVFNLALLDSLEAYVEKNKVKLVIIDPITTFMPTGIDLNRQSDVTDALSLLHEVMQRQNCAGLLMRHWVKGNAYGAGDRGIGSIGYTQISRSGLCVGEDPDDRDLRLIGHFKHNLSGEGPTQAFSLTGGRFAWCGTSPVTANQLALAKPKAHNNGSGQASKLNAWLVEFIGEREREFNEILMTGESLSYSAWAIKKSLRYSGLFEMTQEQDKTVYWFLKDRQEPEYLR